MSTTTPSRSPRSRARGDGTPKVAFFSADWCRGPGIALGGSDYWRLGLPASKLYEDKWDVIFARNLAESTEGDRILVQDPDGNWRDDRDVIVIQRWMGEDTAERILRAREAGQVVVNEVDDDYWNFPEGHVSVQGTDPELNKAANREHYRANVCASSLITVSTPYLGQQLGGWGPPVKLVRNYIDGAWWTPTPPGDFVGWVGGLPWRGKDLEILRETVIPWMRGRRMFFYHGGSVGGHEVEEKLGYDRVTTRPLSTLTDYPRLWEPIRVALVPMEDSTFNRSKSWIKGLEAATRGVPFIHSPHAEYEELGMGRVAREPDEWVWHLEALEDPGTYAADVLANRKRAEELDISKHWTQWVDVLKEAVAVA